jgi:phage/plasmid-associated DNA primase
LKDLTGGEQIVYRLLFSNAISCYRPMHKLHMICNDKPKLNGGDSGVARRVRVIEYNSQFVDFHQVDPACHRCARDTEKMVMMVKDVSMRMAFLRRLLLSFDKRWGYEMPDVVRLNSHEYLDENNPLCAFVSDHVARIGDGDSTPFFTFSAAKELFKRLPRALCLSSKSSRP